MPNGPSVASLAWTRRVIAPARRARASGWPSCGLPRRRTAARCRSATPTPACASSCGCRWRPRPRLGRRLGERGQAAQRLLDGLVLAVEPVRLALGQADGHLNGRAWAALGQLPDDVDVGDLAGDRDPVVGL